MRFVASLALAAALGSTGCTGALFSHMTFRSGPEAGTYESGVAQAPMRLTKPDVLARFGAPSDVIPQAGGDIFVYRLRQADLEVLNLNPAIVLGFGFTVYAQVQGVKVADVLYIHFDETGQVRDIS
ncbi:MAG: hypothetical protein ACYTCU_07755, partial [Planctomycetota bacterium]